MRRKGPEGKITDAIIAYLRSRPKTWCVKIAAGPFQSAGLPDVIGCDFGRFFAFEVKQPGKTATPLQSAVLAAIRRAGGIAAVVTSVDEVAEILGDAIIPEPARNGARMPVAASEGEKCDCCEERPATVERRLEWRTGRDRLIDSAALCDSCRRIPRGMCTSSDPCTVTRHVPLDSGRAE